MVLDIVTPAVLVAVMLAQDGRLAGAGGTSGAKPGADYPVGGTCLVAGGFRDEEYDQAAKLAHKLQSQGFPDAGVFDGAAFRNMTTDLVVIAGAFADAQQARVAGKHLGRGKPAPYAKKCTPVGGSPPPLAARPNRAPSAATPLTPLVAIPVEVPIGCWGWSAKRATALCTTGESTGQGGVHWSLDALGDGGWDDLKLDDRDRAGGLLERHPGVDARRVLEANLVDGEVASLGPATVTLGPNETFHGWAPRVVVRWERKLDHFQGNAEGGWNVWNDRVIVRCAGTGTSDREAFSDLGSGDGRLRMFVLPDRAHVLVELQKDRAEEGDYGPVVHAVLIAVGGACRLAGGDHPGDFK